MPELSAVKASMTDGSINVPKRPAGTSDVGWGEQDDQAAWQFKLQGESWLPSIHSTVRMGAKPVEILNKIRQVCGERRGGLFGGVCFIDDLRSAVLNHASTLPADIRRSIGDEHMGLLMQQVKAELNLSQIHCSTTNDVSTEENTPKEAISSLEIPTLSVHSDRFAQKTIRRSNDDKSPPKSALAFRGNTTQDNSVASSARSSMSSTKGTGVSLAVPVLRPGQLCWFEVPFVQSHVTLLAYGWLDGYNTWLTQQPNKKSLKAKFAKISASGQSFSLQMKTIGLAQLVVPRRIPVWAHESTRKRLHRFDFGKLQKLSRAPAITENSADAESQVFCADDRTMGPHSIQNNVVNSIMSKHSVDFGQASPAVNEVLSLCSKSHSLHHRLSAHSCCNSLQGVRSLAFSDDDQNIVEKQCSMLGGLRCVTTELLCRADEGLESAMHTLERVNMHFRIDDTIKLHSLMVLIAVLKQRASTNADDALLTDVYQIEEKLFRQSIDENCKLAVILRIQGMKRPASLEHAFDILHAASLSDLHGDEHWTPNQKIDNFSSLQIMESVRMLFQPSWHCECCIVDEQWSIDQMNNSISDINASPDNSGSISDAFDSIVYVMEEAIISSIALLRILSLCKDVYDDQGLLALALKTCIKQAERLEEAWRMWEAVVVRTETGCWLSHECHIDSLGIVKEKIVSAGELESTVTKNALKSVPSLSTRQGGNTSLKNDGDACKQLVANKDLSHINSNPDTDKTSSAGECEGSNVRYTELEFPTCFLFSLVSGTVSSLLRSACEKNKADNPANCSGVEDIHLNSNDRNGLRAARSHTVTGSKRAAVDGNEVFICDLDVNCCENADNCGSLQRESLSFPLVQQCLAAVSRVSQGLLIGCTAANEGTEDVFMLCKSLMKGSIAPILSFRSYCDKYLSMFARATGGMNSNENVAYHRLLQAKIAAQWNFEGSQPYGESLQRDKFTADESPNISIKHRHASTRTLPEIQINFLSNEIFPHSHLLTGSCASAMWSATICQAAVIIIGNNHSASDIFADVNHEFLSSIEQMLSILIYNVGLKNTVLLAVEFDDRPLEAAMDIQSDGFVLDSAGDRSSEHSGSQNSHGFVQVSPWEGEQLDSMERTIHLVEQIRNTAIHVSATSSALLQEPCIFCWSLLKEFQSVMSSHIKDFPNMQNSATMLDFSTLNHNYALSKSFKANALKPLLAFAGADWAKIIWKQLQGLMDAEPSASRTNCLDNPEDTLQTLEKATSAEELLDIARILAQSFLPPLNLPILSEASSSIGSSDTDHQEFLHATKTTAIQLKAMSNVLFCNDETLREWKICFEGSERRIKTNPWNDMLQLYETEESEGFECSTFSPLTTDSIEGLCRSMRSLVLSMIQFLSKKSADKFHKSSLEEDELRDWMGFTRDCLHCIFVQHNPNCSERENMTVAVDFLAIPLVELLLCLLDRFGESLHPKQQKRERHRSANVPKNCSHLLECLSLTSIGIGLLQSSFLILQESGARLLYKILSLSCFVNTMCAACQSSDSNVNMTLCNQDSFVQPNWFGLQQVLQNSLGNLVCPILSTLSQGICSSVLSDVMQPSKNSVHSVSFFGPGFGSKSYAGTDVLNDDKASASLLRVRTLACLLGVNLCFCQEIPSFSTSLINFNGFNLARQCSLLALSPVAYNCVYDNVKSKNDSIKFDFSWCAWSSLKSSQQLLLMCSSIACELQVCLRRFMTENSSESMRKGAVSEPMITSVSSLVGSMQSLFNENNVINHIIPDFSDEYPFEYRDFDPDMVESHFKKSSQRTDKPRHGHDDIYRSERGIQWLILYLRLCKFLVIDNDFECTDRNVPFDQLVCAKSEVYYERSKHLSRLSPGEWSSSLFPVFRLCSSIHIPSSPGISSVPDIHCDVHISEEHSTPSHNQEESLIGCLGLHRCFSCVLPIQWNYSKHIIEFACSLLRTCQAEMLHIHQQYLSALEHEALFRVQKQYLFPCLHFSVGSLMNVSRFPSLRLSLLARAAIEVFARRQQISSNATGSTNDNVQEQEEHHHSAQTLNFTFRNTHCRSNAFLSLDTSSMWQTDGIVDVWHSIEMVEQLCSDEEPIFWKLAEGCLQCMLFLGQQISRNLELSLRQDWTEIQRIKTSMRREAFRCSIHRSVQTLVSLQCGNVPRWRLPNGSEQWFELLQSISTLKACLGSPFFSHNGDGWDRADIKLISSYRAYLPPNDWKQMSDCMRRNLILPASKVSLQTEISDNQQQARSTKNVANLDGDDALSTLQMFPSKPKFIDGLCSEKQLPEALGPAGWHTDLDSWLCNVVIDSHLTSVHMSTISAGFVAINWLVGSCVEQQDIMISQIDGSSRTAAQEFLQLEHWQGCNCQSAPVSEAGKSPMSQNPGSQFPSLVVWQTGELLCTSCAQSCLHMQGVMAEKEIGLHNLVLLEECLYRDVQPATGKFTNASEEALGSDVTSMNWLNFVNIGALPKGTSARQVLKGKEEHKPNTNKRLSNSERQRVVSERMLLSVPTALGLLSWSSVQNQNKQRLLAFQNKIEQRWNGLSLICAASSSLIYRHKGANLKQESPIERLQMLDSSYTSAAMAVLSTFWMQPMFATLIQGVGWHHPFLSFVSNNLGHQKFDKPGNNPEFSLNQKDSHGSVKDSDLQHWPSHSHVIWLAAQLCSQPACWFSLVSHFSENFGSLHWLFAAGSRFTYSRALGRMVPCSTLLSLYVSRIQQNFKRCSAVCDVNHKAIAIDVSSSISLLALCRCLLMSVCAHTHSAEKMSEGSGLYPSNGLLRHDWQSILIIKRWLQEAAGPSHPRFARQVLRCLSNLQELSNTLSELSLDSYSTILNNSAGISAIMVSIPQTILHTPGVYLAACCRIGLYLSPETEERLVSSAYDRIVLNKPRKPINQSAVALEPLVSSLNSVWVRSLCHFSRSEASIACIQHCVMASTLNSIMHVLQQSCAHSEPIAHLPRLSFFRAVLTASCVAVIRACKNQSNGSISEFRIIQMGFVNIDEFINTILKIQEYLQQLNGAIVKKLSNGSDLSFVIKCQESQFKNSEGSFEFSDFDASEHTISMVHLDPTCVSSATLQQKFSWVATMQLIWGSLERLLHVRQCFVSSPGSVAYMKTDISVRGAAVLQESLRQMCSLVETFDTSLLLVSPALCTVLGKVLEKLFTMGGAWQTTSGNSSHKDWVFQLISCCEPNSVSSGMHLSIKSAKKVLGNISSILHASHFSSARVRCSYSVQQNLHEADISGCSFCTLMHTSEIDLYRSISCDLLSPVFLSKSHDLSQFGDSSLPCRAGVLFGSAMGIIENKNHNYHAQSGQWQEAKEALLRVFETSASVTHCLAILLSCSSLLIPLAHYADISQVLIDIVARPRVLHLQKEVVSSESLVNRFESTRDMVAMQIAYPSGRPCLELDSEGCTMIWQQELSQRVVAYPHIFVTAGHSFEIPMLSQMQTLTSCMRCLTNLCLFPPALERFIDKTSNLQAVISAGNLLHQLVLKLYRSLGEQHVQKTDEMTPKTAGDHNQNILLCAISDAEDNRTFQGIRLASVCWLHPLSTSVPITVKAICSTLWFLTNACQRSDISIDMLSMMHGGRTLMRLWDVSKTCSNGLCNLRDPFFSDLCIETVPKNIFESCAQLYLVLSENPFIDRLISPDILQHLMKGSLQNKQNQIDDDNSVQKMIQQAAKRFLCINSSMDQFTDAHSMLMLHGLQERFLRHHDILLSEIHSFASFGKRFDSNKTISSTVAAEDGQNWILGLNSKSKDHGEQIDVLLGASFSLSYDAVDAKAEKISKSSDEHCYWVRILKSDTLQEESSCLAAHDYVELQASCPSGFGGLDSHRISTLIQGVQVQYFERRGLAWSCALNGAILDWKFVIDDPCIQLSNMSVRPSFAPSLLWMLHLPSKLPDDVHLRKEISTQLASRLIQHGVLQSLISLLPTHYQPLHAAEFVAQGCCAAERSKELFRKYPNAEGLDQVANHPWSCVCPCVNSIFCLVCLTLAKLADCHSPALFNAVKFVGTGTVVSLCLTTLLSEIEEAVQSIALGMCRHLASCPGDQVFLDWSIPSIQSQILNLRSVFRRCFRLCRAVLSLWLVKIPDSLVREWNWEFSNRKTLGMCIPETEDVHVAKITTRLLILLSGFHDSVQDSSVDTMNQEDLVSEFERQTLSFQNNSNSEKYLTGLTQMIPLSQNVSGDIDVLVSLLKVVAQCAMSASVRQDAGLMAQLHTALDSCMRVLFCDVGALITPSNFELHSALTQCVFSLISDTNRAWRTVQCAKHLLSVRCSNALSYENRTNVLCSNGLLYAQLIVSPLDWLTAGNHSFVNIVEDSLHCQHGRIPLVSHLAVKLLSTISPGCLLRLDSSWSSKYANQSLVTGNIQRSIFELQEKVILERRQPIDQEFSEDNVEMHSAKGMQCTWDHLLQQLPSAALDIEMSCSIFNCVPSNLFEFSRTHLFICLLLSMSIQSFAHLPLSHEDKQCKRSQRQSWRTLLRCICDSNVLSHTFISSLPTDIEFGPSRDAVQNATNLARTDNWIHDCVSLKMDGKYEHVPDACLQQLSILESSLLYQGSERVSDIHKMASAYHSACREYYQAKSVAMVVNQATVSDFFGLSDEVEKANSLINVGLERLHTPNSLEYNNSFICSHVIGAANLLYVNSCSCSTEELEELHDSLLKSKMMATAINCLASPPFGRAQHEAIGNTATFLESLIFRLSGSQLSGFVHQLLVKGILETLCLSACLMMPTLSVTRPTAQGSLSSTSVPVLHQEETVNSYVEQVDWSCLAVLRFCFRLLHASMLFDDCYTTGMASGIQTVAMDHASKYVSEFQSLKPNPFICASITDAAWCIAAASRRLDIRGQLLCEPVVKFMLELLEKGVSAAVQEISSTVADPTRPAWTQFLQRLPDDPRLLDSNIVDVTDASECITCFSSLGVRLVPRHSICSLLSGCMAALTFFTDSSGTSLLLRTMISEHAPQNLRFLLSNKVPSVCESSAAISVLSSSLHDENLFQPSSVRIVQMSQNLVEILGTKGLTLK